MKHWIEGRQTEDRKARKTGSAVITLTKYPIDNKLYYIPTICIPVEMSLLLSKTGCLTRLSTTTTSITRREMGLWSSIIDNIETKKKKMKQEKMEELRSDERNLWREYQEEQTRFRERKRASQEIARWQEQEEQRLRQEQHEAAVKAELEKKMKSSGVAEDKLDEEYFKDYKRFDKRQDQRDPLFEDVKKGRGGEAEDLQSMLRDGLRETRETFQQMKDSQPFSYTGATTEGGRFGFRTVEVGNWVVIGILLVFAGLAVNELRAVYQENVIENEALKQKIK